ncbi:hypothetical protein J2Z83_002589 [Virgibacillus natechei]|uniref:Uncharacterized protein n=1 Tax=Virgibacillus natechei TaxID=1216297 RepID=A0ABS4IHN6_9BACI|nr:hypothetical protein [Virgibacillus natechei]MBP1970468.1 hypothetical protein [Virgibacillus natechei]UZD13883.1 hypothetical protein OLD84_04925 [Virgibacillus natechei]
MSSGWMIGPLVIKSSLVALIGSFLAGFILLWLLSPFSKIETKKLIDEVGSLLLTFIISLWIGKILVNFSTFLSDPLAVLAYPSDSSAFYIGFLLTIIYSTFKIIKDYSHLQKILLSFMYVFLSASFIYEFIRINIGSDVHNWDYLGLLVLLLVIIIVLQERLTTSMLTFIAILGWSIGQLIRTLFTNPTVFQFSLDPWFWIVLILLSFVLLLYHSRKVKG